MFCYTRITTLLRNTQNGRPKSLLIFVLIFSLSSPLFAAQAESPVPHLENQNTLANSSETDIFDNKLFVGVVVALIVQGLFPVFRYFYTKRKQRDTYIAYIKANVESSLKRFGQNATDEELALLSKLPFEYEWLSKLQRSNQPVPQVMLYMQLGLDRCEASLETQCPYLPIFKFSGQASGDIDHEHVAWQLNRQQSVLISEYLLSQQQIQSTIADLYTPPLFDLFSSEDFNTKKRWYLAACSLLDELLENYQYSQELKQELQKWSPE